MRLVRATRKESCVPDLALAGGSDLWQLFAALEGPGTRADEGGSDAAAPAVEAVRHLTDRPGSPREQPLSVW
jgi:hypothetical protein